MLPHMPPQHCASTWTLEVDEEGGQSHLEAGCVREKRPALFLLVEDFVEKKEVSWSPITFLNNWGEGWHFEVVL